MKKITHSIFVAAMLLTSAVFTNVETAHAGGSTKFPVIYASQ